MNKFRQEDGVVFETSAVVLSVDGDMVRIAFDGLELETHFQSLVMLKPSVHVGDRVVHNEEHARVRERLENDVYLLHVIGKKGSEAYRIANRDEIKLYNKDDRLFVHDSLMPAAVVPPVRSMDNAEAEVPAAKEALVEESPASESGVPEAVDDGELLELVMEAPAVEEADASTAESKTDVLESAEAGGAAAQESIAEEAVADEEAGAAESPAAPVTQRPDVATMAMSFGSLVDKGRSRAKRTDLEKLGVTDTVQPVKSGDMVLDDDLNLRPDKS